MRKSIEGTVNEEKLRKIIDEAIEEKGISLNEEKMEETSKCCIIKIVKEDEKLEFENQEEELKINADSLDEEEKQERIDYYTMNTERILRELMTEEIFGIKSGE